MRAYHLIVGGGLPLALHLSVTLAPSLTTTSASLVVGGMKNVRNYFIEGVQAFNI